MDISIIQIAVTILIVILTYCLYQYVLKPYRLYLYYKKILLENYKTCVFPFSMTSSLLKQFKGDLEEHGDSQYVFKKLYPEYQVSISTVKGTTYIDLLDP